MTTILIILSCAAAIALGFILGPGIERGVEKFKEWDKKNTEESKVNAKKFSTAGFFFFNPDGAGEKEFKSHLKFIVFFLTSLLGLVATQHKLFFWLFGIAFGMMIYKSIIPVIWGFFFPAE